MKYLTVFIIILFLASCTPAEHADQKIKIGVISIMSGDFAVVGEQVRRSVELTLKEESIDNYEFIFEDGQCDKKLSVSSARKLIDIDKVQLIIAAGCSDTTIAIAPIANKEKIVILMPSTGGKNIDDAGEYVFRNGNSDIQSAVQPAKDFIEKFNFENVALISDQTEAMEDIRQHFKLEFDKLKGNLILDETVSPKEVDFRTIITKIENKYPDAVFINSQTGITGAHFIKQFRELGKTIPIFTNFNTAANTQTYEIAGDAMEEVYFYDPDYNQDSEKVQDFLQKYENEYRSKPHLLFHSIATRDAVMMATQAIGAAGSNGQQIHNWLLENIQDWDGFMGKISFDEKGNSQSGYTLKQIQQGDFVSVK